MAPATRCPLTIKLNEGERQKKKNVPTHALFSLGFPHVIIEALRFWSNVVGFPYNIIFFVKTILIEIFRL